MFGRSPAFGRWRFVLVLGPPRETPICLTRLSLKPPRNFHKPRRGVAGRGWVGNREIGSIRIGPSLSSRARGPPACAASTPIHAAPRANLRLVWCRIINTLLNALRPQGPPETRRQERGEGRGTQCQERGERVSGGCSYTYLGPALSMGRASMCIFQDHRLCIFRFTRIDLWITAS